MPTPPRWSAGSASSRAVPRRRSFIAPRGAACWPQRSASAPPSSLPTRGAGPQAGCAPLARQKSLVLGDALVWTPFCVYGGVAATSDRARALLEQAAVELGEKLGVDHVEFRNLRPRRDDWERHASP